MGPVGRGLRLVFLAHEASSAIKRRTVNVGTPKDHINIRRILQTVTSGIPLILGLGTRV